MIVIMRISAKYFKGGFSLGQSSTTTITQLTSSRLFLHDVSATKYVPLADSSFSRCHPTPPFVLARSRLGTIELFLVHVHLMKARGTLRRNGVHKNKPVELVNCVIV